MTKVIATMEDYFNDFKRWFLSPVHFNRALKNAYDQFLILYFERLVYAVHKIKKIHAKEYETVELNKDLVKAKASEFSSNPSLKDKDYILTRITSDLNKLKELAQNPRFAPALPTSYLVKIDNCFKAFSDLLVCNKSDILEYYSLLYDSFKPIGANLLVAILILRDDCDGDSRNKFREFYKTFAAGRQEEESKQEQH